MEITPQSWSYLGSRGSVRLVNSDSSVVKKRPPGRPAGEGANREAILDAAKRLFADRGYDGASMRAIAAQAGVDPALIRHFFTDKEGLFAAVVPGRSELPQLLLAALAGDPDDVGERLAEVYLAAWEDSETEPILRAMVRTAFTSERGAGLLREIIATRIGAQIPPGHVASDEPMLRLALAGSHLLGVASARRVAGIEALADADRSRIVAIVAPAIQHYLTGELP
ncbi:TetR family transcriptional regulator [Gordonia jinhuaensis]|uniref:TetR family transcriptional regulator n=1 Tax=Gordonia jinhuaensis TaxID=1517702 RepID=A0A916TDY9_9ACTN|nr:TetR family transcriptional regulator [Gordonia jinhuaensis]